MKRTEAGEEWLRKQAALEEMRDANPVLAYEVHEVVPGAQRIEVTRPRGRETYLVVDTDVLDVSVDTTSSVGEP